MEMAGLSGVSSVLFINLAVSMLLKTDCHYSEVPVFQVSKKPVTIQSDSVTEAFDFTFLCVRIS